jgi:predicted dehydrogenase
VGILSFAHVHAAGYAKLLSGMPDVEVWATDPDAPPEEDGGPRAQELAEKSGIRYFDRVDDLLALAPDAVIVTSENVRHRDLVERSAAAGAHVLCEKPLATTSGDAEAMIASCARAGAILMVAHPVRYSPAFTAARELYRTGALGSLQSIEGVNTGKLPRERQWFVDKELAGGGALMDHVVHCADLVDDLTMGEPAAVVYAAANRILHPDEDIRVETAGIVAVTYSSGLSATIDCSWSEPANGPTWGGLTLRLICTEGTVEVDPFGDRLTGTDHNGEVYVGVAPDLDAAMISSFLSAVRTSGRAERGRTPTVVPMPDGESGLRSLRIIEAALESARRTEAVVVTVD